MTTEELLRLIAAGEGKTCEFKSSFNAQAIETAVAFANTSGGKILIGINDNAEIVGVRTSIETVQNWINEVKSKTLPQQIPDGETIDFNGKTVVVLSVQEYPIKPVAVRGKYYKRIENANHLLSISEVVNMRLREFNTSWDFYTNNHYSVENISIEKVQSVIDTMNRRGRRIDDDPLNFLFKADLLRGEQITNAAFLLFTNRDTVFTTIELGRFQTETIIKDSARTKTDIVAELEIVIGFIKKHINKQIIITGNVQNTERWQYPIEAIREIVANMIVHRDYSVSSDSIVKIFDDKIEFYNPGKLPEDISVEDLLRSNYRSSPRNKLIADIFKDLGVIEKYGSGIKRIISYCRDAGLPTPLFENTADGFMVTLYSSERANGGDRVPDRVPDRLTDNQQKIVCLLAENSRLSLAELAKTVGISKRKIPDNVNVLKEKGAIIRVGSPKSGYWQVVAAKKQENLN